MVIASAQVLVLGPSFKENCPDLRNTRVVDVTQALQRYGIEPLVVDPWVDPEQSRREYGLKVLSEIPMASAGVVVVAVAHEQFKALTPAQWKQIRGLDGVLVDLKGIVPRQLGALRL